MTRPAQSAPNVESPTVVQRWLRGELKRLRKEAGFTQDAVARELRREGRWSKAKVGHLETGHVLPHREDLQQLLPVYGVRGTRLEWYLELCDRARDHGWWDNAPGVPSWFGLYLGLEWGATVMVSYDLGFIPGLLQTRRYVEAVIRDGETDEDEVANQVNQRMRRQEALSRPRPLKLHAIIDEAALYRVVGDVDVMREQIEHLIALTGQQEPRDTNLDDDEPFQVFTLQILPFSAGAHRGQLGSFSWMGFDDSPHPIRDALDPAKNDPGVGYVENQAGGQYIDEPQPIARYLDTFRLLSGRALSPARSVGHLRTLLTKDMSE
ncbi:helix-turn-helix transcriptional regulator [Lentzea sp. NBRC 102530]|uniref:helix-turn-helix domain-containing protein n=1 Tax=Lentzea sp. NBRC 102530 TaxID=3032201 RepID=UPI0024A03009|nr:helix-turn-helix transcriptional regulator [Lentzea sp. NBRC 102530]GLY54800.1 transcriptional regulator [Lentzea sp. NBRC 102530]